MRSSIFDVIAEEAQALPVVELAKTLDDGKPCAVRVRPLRIGDWLAMGESIPMPSGKTSDEWSVSEKAEWYTFIKKIVPLVVVEARHVAPHAPPVFDAPATEAEAEANRKAMAQPLFVETWIPIRVVPDGQHPNRDRNEISIDELESLGDAIVRIANAVLYSQDVGGEMKTLPEMGAEFRVEAEGPVGPGVGSGEVATAPA